VRAARPEARLSGFTVEKMAAANKAVELIVGVMTDPVFGPVILFGAGGTAVEIVRDRAMALPPLNVPLARELIGRTRVARLLAGYRDVPAADMGALERALLGIAQLIADVPDIAELDINPLLADARGALALDARIRVARSARRNTGRFAIRPYPVELESTITAGGRGILVRPIRPEDEAKYPVLLEKTSAGDIYFRLFRTLREMSHAELARFTQIDYDREMALLALAGDEITGIVRAVTDPDNERAEFAIIVRSDWSGQGIGYALMEKIIAYCRSRGTGEIFGEILSDNHRMLELARALQFRIGPTEYGITRVALDLSAGR
jgi:acetyltransferase